MTHQPAPARHPARRARVLLLVAALVLTVAAVPVALAVAGDEPAPAPAAAPGQAPETSPEPTTAQAEPTGPSEPSDPALRLPRFAAAAGHDWVHTVPPGMPLEHALPPSESEDAGTVEDLAFCDVPALRPSHGVDHRTAGAAGPEYGELRDLRVFVDDRAAHRYLKRFVEAVTGCPRQRVGGGTTWRHDLLPTDLEGDEGVTGVQTFEQSGMVVLGANWWEVVRVGNAVLVTATGGEWMPGPRLEAAIRRHARDVEPLVAAMCAFSEAGCDG
jgi:hypothetical protein